MANEGHVLALNKVPHDPVQERRNWQIAGQMLPATTYSATRAPTVNDDITEGWKVGSAWVNTAEPALYRCAANTDGAAVWQRMVGFEVQAGGTVAGGDAPDVLADNEIIRAHTNSGDIQGSIVTLTDGGAMVDVLSITPQSGLSLKIVDPASAVSAVLSTGSLATSDKTFTYPNETGIMAVRQNMLVYFTFLASSGVAVS